MEPIVPTTEVGPPTSLEAYVRLEEPDDAYVTEVVRGRLVREPRPGYRHARLQAHLAWLLRDHVEGGGLGVVLTGAGVVLSQDPPTVRGPDVAFLRRERVPEDDPAGLLRVVPDLVAEIVSPGERNVLAWILDYLDAGAREAWAVDPGTRTVTAYRSRRDVRVVDVGETLEEVARLPGVALEVEAIFGS